MPQRAESSDGLARSVALFRAFRVEQADPERFYGLLASDSVRMVSQHVHLSGRRVLDVGAGPRQFARAFRDAGAEYVAVDADERAIDPLHERGTHALVAFGENLPLRDGSVDVAFSSNVFEHARRPETLATEMVRVTRPGGVVVLSYTNWLSPWGGHETSPYHWLGGERAVRLYRRRHGHDPKNRIDETLFRTSVAQGMRWARSQADAELVLARPRYYPRWMHALVEVPAIREVATWNLWLVLRKR
jgi:SAM-dependent methyltransferase